MYWFFIYIPSRSLPEEIGQRIQISSAPDVLSPKDSFDFRKGNSRLGAQLQRGNLRRKFLPPQEKFLIGLRQNIRCPEEEVISHVQIVDQILGLPETVGEEIYFCRIRQIRNHRPVAVVHQRHRNAGHIQKGIRPLSTAPNHDIRHHVRLRRPVTIPDSRLRNCRRT